MFLKFTTQKNKNSPLLVIGFVKIDSKQFNAITDMVNIEHNISVEISIHDYYHIESNMKYAALSIDKDTLSKVEGLLTFSDNKVYVKVEF